MKFLHLADVHLGAAPDAGNSWSAGRGQEIWDTFRDAIALASREQVDLLLIAGDLFHRQPTAEALREVDYLFSTIPHTRVVLIAGNHDYLAPASPYYSFRFSRNVECLFSTECECLRYPEIKTEIYGFSYDRQEITEPLYDRLKPVNNNYIHILLGHGGDARHIPINADKVRRNGFDYVALGHIHRPGALIANKIVYPGALSPIDCDDLGPHGCVLGEIRGHHANVRFVPLAKRQYRLMELVCSDADTTFSLRDRLERQIRDTGDGDLYRVILTGERLPGAKFDVSRLKDCGMITDVEDRTVPALHVEELRRRFQGQLIGRYIDSFDGEHLSEAESKALQYGLEALIASRKDQE